MLPPHINQSFKVPTQINLRSLRFGEIEKEITDLLVQEMLEEDDSSETCGLPGAMVDTGARGLGQRCPRGLIHRQQIAGSNQLR